MPTLQEALDLAQQHHTAGRLPEAEGIYQQILQAKPEHPDVLHMLGVIAHQMGKDEFAVDLITEALAVEPDDATAHFNLGTVLRKLGKLEKSVACYRKAVMLEPDYAKAHNNLGVALQDLGKLEEAAASYREALALKPDYAEAHINLGNTLRNLGMLDEAVASFHRALTIEPDYAEAHSSLGGAFLEQGKFDEAVARYKKALVIKPDFAEAYNNLGIAFKKLAKLDNAIENHHKALAIKPDYAKAYGDLGNALRRRGKQVEAIASFKKALALKPDFAEAHSSLIYGMNYDQHCSQQEILAESRRWETAHALVGSTREVSHLLDRDPERRLRIGYVSPDFRRHSVSYFLDPLVGGHDRRKFEVFCYAQVANPDSETRRFRDKADAWCSSVGMTTQVLVERIRADGIDILVDLAGHTENNRLIIFAEHPAPVQVTWLGYPNTTGLTAIDYRLTDEIADPEGPGDALYSEKLVRLPKGFLCYNPGSEAPDVADLSALVNGFVTFGSFNNPLKMTAVTVAAWARILKGVPGSRLIMKDWAFASEEARQQYRALFAENGVDGKQLDFHAAIGSRFGHLEAYERIDIGLDPFPYNGTTTTCEALWMGVPVITLNGERHASRVGASILTCIGLTELIADSVDSYVTAAVALAKNPDRLVRLRRDLRAAMAASPLCDAAGFTRDVEAAYRDMWRRWCAK